MSAPQSDPKKTSCLAIGGTGCLILIIVLLVGGGVVWWKFGPWFMQKYEEISKDPERGKAMLFVEFSPDVEFVSIDDANRTLTFKVKSTGEVVTAGFAVLSSGRVTIVNGKVHGLEGQPEAAEPPAVEVPAPVTAPPAPKSE
ncbi:MAG TPA: hypothetical protein VD994_19075 [Prosthecobacter sp.]|nr:hypothetical protein [Prosthecobacter sp.]